MCSWPPLKETVGMRRAVMVTGPRIVSSLVGTPVKKEKKDGPTPTIAKKAPTKKKDVVVIDDDDEERLMPFEAFSARLTAHIGDDRDLVDKLLHKYHPVPRP